MNEYSSNTKKAAEKLAGKACANVHDDERLSELFALAPHWADGIVTEKSGCRFWATKDAKPHCAENAYGEFIAARMRLIDKDGNGESWLKSWMEIPPRERELNRLADGYDFWPLLISENYQTDVYEAEWQERRKIRIAAGLIDVNDTDVVDMQDSQQDEVSEPDWGSAPEGTTHYATSDRVIWGWLKNENDRFFYFNGDQDRFVEYSSKAAAKEHFKSAIPRPPHDSHQEWDGDVNLLVEMIIKCEDMTAAWLESLAEAKRKSAEEKRRDEVVNDALNLLSFSDDDFEKQKLLMAFAFKLYDNGMLVSTNRLTEQED